MVGVILNLACWFALHFWFADLGERRIGPLHIVWPSPSSVDPFALLLSLAAIVAVLRFRVGTLAILGACAAAGLLRMAWI